jgi:hypothetical protein
MTKFTSFIFRLIATVAMFTTMAGAFLAFSPISTYAQPATPQFGNNVIKGFENIDGSQQGITGIITNIANWFIFILAAVAVLFIIYGGFLYVTDDGSGTKAGQGKKIVLQALVGLVIAIVSFTLVTVIVNITKSADFGGTTGSNTNTGPGMINIL